MIPDCHWVVACLRGPLTDHLHEFLDARSLKRLGGLAFIEALVAKWRCESTTPPVAPLWAVSVVRGDDG